MTVVLDDAIRRVKQLDPDLILGHLCWYTVHDQQSRTAVSQTEVANSIRKSGLGVTAPSAPKSHDVFRRVTSDAQRKKVPTGTDGIFQNVLLRDVTDAGQKYIVRRLVVETVNSKGKALSYHQLVDIEYHRDTGKITHSYRENYGSNPQLADRTILLVKSEYAALQDKLTSWTIREFIKKLLYDRGATCVRAGGAVFFLRQEFAADLEAIETFTNDLPTGLAEFHSLPLLDDQKQRGMLRKAFESETMGSIYEILVQIDEYRKEGKQITSGKYASMMMEFKRLKKKTQEYSSLLETEMGQADSALEIFEGKMKQLLNNVKE